MYKNKRGQFYLILAVIIIAAVLAFAVIANEIKSQDYENIDFSAQELRVESQAIFDYVAYQGQDFETTFLDFTEKYANYSNMENLYFVFGDATKIIVAAKQKKYGGEIFVDGEKLEIPKNTYISAEYNSPGEEIVIEIAGVTKTFDLNEGNNFYFVLSKIQENGNYFLTGDMIQNKDLENL